MLARAKASIAAQQSKIKIAESQLVEGRRLNVELQSQLDVLEGPSLLSPLSLLYFLSYTQTLSHTHTLSLSLSLSLALALVLILIIGRSVRKQSGASPLSAASAAAAAEARVAATALKNLPPNSTSAYGGPTLRFNGRGEQIGVQTVRFFFHSVYD